MSADNYSVTGQVTNTASATLPLINLVSASSTRVKLYAMDLSCPTAPSNDAVDLSIQRGTAAGTPGSSPTPQSNDPAYKTAVATVGLAIFSVGPTLTAGAVLWRAGINKQIPYHWQAAPEKELKLPATTGACLNLMAATVTSAYAQNITLQWEE